jgi:late competence protein required for DNA uptake (superfamily II DNA/RNA helicase)
LPVKDNRNPIVEPRTILTRINLNKDIPFVIYEYLKWSMDCDRRVVICVPDEEKIENVYFYMNNYCRNLSKNIICLTKGKVNKKLIANFEKMKKAVLITNDFEQVFYDINDSDVMIYFASHPEFDYKKFIYFCGSVDQGEKSWKGEVIFLANEETEDMEKAKSITRNFNKEAWDLGLLRI